jgi:hypothetical protein
VLPLDIIRQSQIWRCSTLPPDTKLGKSAFIIQTVSCSACASIVGYKIGPEASAVVDRTELDPSKVGAGYHFLKHEMILLYSENVPMALPTKQLSTQTDAAKSTSPFSLQSLTLPALSQFIIYEMIRIAETKGIFNFVVCKYFSDAENEIRQLKKESSMVAIKMHLLHWKTITATYEKSSVSMAHPSFDENMKDPTSIKPPSTEVLVPLWQRRAMIYYETIAGDRNNFSKQKRIAPFIQEDKAVNSFRKQFIAQHTAWCCPDGKIATAGNNNKEHFGLFTKGVVMADTTSTYYGGNVDEVIDASITRLYLSTTEFDLILKELQESSNMFSHEVVHAVRASVTAVNTTLNNDPIQFGLASIVL